MLGSVLAFRRDEHLKLTIAVRRLPLRLQRTASVLATCLVLVFIAVAIYPTVVYVVGEWGYRTPGLDIPLTVRLGAIPVGFALIFVVAAMALFRAAPWRQIVAVLAAIGVACLALWGLAPLLFSIGNYNLLLLFHAAPRLHDLPWRADRVCLRDRDVDLSDLDHRRSAHDHGKPHRRGDERSDPDGHPALHLPRLADGDDGLGARAGRVPAHGRRSFPWRRLLRDDRRDVSRLRKFRGEGGGHGGGRAGAAAGNAAARIGPRRARGADGGDRRDVGDDFLRASFSSPPVQSPASPSDRCSPPASCPQRSAASA